MDENSLFERIETMSSELSALGVDIGELKEEIKGLAEEQEIVEKNKIELKGFTDDELR